MFIGHGRSGHIGFRPQPGLPGQRPGVIRPPLPPSRPLPPTPSPQTVATHVLLHTVLRGLQDSFEHGPTGAPARPPLPPNQPTNRPVASRPLPAELPLAATGQQGASPQLTGSIGNAAELAQFAYAGYNGGKFGPVSIVKATLNEGGQSSPVHLVGISGTEPVTHQSTGWVTNLKAGFELNNPGLRNAKEAILRTVPEGSTLVLTGHSQGGMIAQQLAADAELKAKYNIKSTVTFGSPLVGAGFREGEVHRVAARFDPVPRLSLETTLLPWWGLLGQQNIGTNAGLNGIKGHSTNYTDETNTRLMKMDALGRVNPRTPATLTFHPADRLFFTSPTQTEAGRTPPPPPLYPPAP